MKSTNPHPSVLRGFGPATEKTGALVISGDYNGLTIARSLGRHRIPVWILAQPRDNLAQFSRYTSRTLPWIEGGDEERAEYLLKLAATHRLEGWVLFPTSDEMAGFLARSRSVLSQRFRVSAPAWDVLRWAYDKRLTYRLADDQQVDRPLTFYPSNESDLQAIEVEFPAILKPANHSATNRFVRDKAWPAADRHELLARYREARTLVPADVILVQEMIPGGGECQFSYAALCQNGQPLASLTACRRRQYPIDFGHSSSMVETVEVPEIRAASLRLLKALNYSGLVEVEYKLDPRSGRYKLLDINPRIWTWAALGCRAGVDFPYLLWQMMTGKPIADQTGRAGARWVRMSTDILAAAQEIIRGRITLDSYLRSLSGPIEFALLAMDDLIPGVLDLPLSFRRHLFRKSSRSAPPLVCEAAAPQALYSNLATPVTDVVPSNQR